MRKIIGTAATIVTLVALHGSSSAQAPRPDDPSRSTADRPLADTPRPRREPRPDEDSPPPPPGKGPKGKADGPRNTPPASTPNAFAPGFPSTPLPPGAAPGQPVFPRDVPPGAGRAFYGFGAAQAFPGRPGIMPGALGGPAPFGEAPDDPEMRDLMKQDAELEQQTHNIAHQYREAGAEDRPRVRESLADVVAKHFDVRQKRRELQIKRMEEELKRLRDEIAKRNEARKTITDNRLRELTGEPRDLDF